MLATYGWAISARRFLWFGTQDPTGCKSSPTCARVARAMVYTTTLLTKEFHSPQFLPAMALSHTKQQRLADFMHPIKFVLLLISHHAFRISTFSL